MATVVIIPGAETKSPKFLKWLTSPFYKYYGVNTEDDHWTENLSDYLRLHHGIHSEVFHWGGGISEASLHAAAIRLIWFLETIPDTEVILFTKSLGGNVADIALELGHLHVKKIIYVAVPHHNFSKRHLRKIPFINIFSQDDNYLDLAINVLYWGKGSKELPGAENIILEKVRHSDFNKNREVQYEGKQWKLFEFYSSLIKQKY